MPEVTYRVKARKGRDEFVKVTARNHTITIDEPIEKGGTDTGMNPVEMLLGSIAACLTLTISIYAEAMGVQVDDIQVEAEGDLNSAGMKGSARVRPGFYKIRPHISVKTDAAPEIFQQVIDLAVLRCPVEDSISKGVEFDEPVVTIDKK